jgi:hypothetical protein
VKTAYGTPPRSGQKPAGGRGAQTPKAKRAAFCYAGGRGAHGTHYVSLNLLLLKSEMLVFFSFVI